VPVDLLCIRCKSRLTAEKNIGNDYQTTQNNSTSQELENLHEDMLELNKVLRVVERYSVKNAILAEIDLISAKIDSLHVPTATTPTKEPLWTEVVKRKKKISPTQRRSHHNIPMINNRYNLLPLSEKCKNSETTSLNIVQQIRTTKQPNKKRNKIVILGDSHARGCASEVQHHLDNTFEIQGTVKPGANLDGIVTPLTTSHLTKKDIVVLCGGTREIGRNESKKALQQIRNFVQNHNQTNVIVVSAPYRHDLDPNSCVNKEVTVYNRKLKKHLKVFDNTKIVEVDPQRELYTRHGLHLNQNGKEQMAKKIVLTVKSILHKKTINPIVLSGKTHIDALATDHRMKNIPKHDTTESNNTQASTSNNPTSVIRSSTRLKKSPNTMLKDFLW